MFNKIPKHRQPMSKSFSGTKTRHMSYRRRARNTLRIRSFSGRLYDLWSSSNGFHKSNPIPEWYK